MQLVELDISDSNKEIEFFIDQLYLELFGKDALLSNEDKVAIKNQWQKQQPAHWAFKVVQNKNAVAFFTLAESFSYFAQGAYGIINELWVAEEYRSKGVGGEVLKYIKQIAEDKGWRRVDVSAPHFERWIKTFEFYQKHGFSYTGKKLKYLVAEH